MNYESYEVHYDDTVIEVTGENTVVTVSDGRLTLKTDGSVKIFIPTLTEIEDEA